uniref:indole-3-glycerol-phosphate synthase n=1 Tax=Physcomitrium patens TaxID=3218 RepID=A9TUX8_PHYPA
MRNTQGITIRRRPATGPPIHNVGPFQFKIQSEGNTPRNILEEIVWHKDVEVAQVSYQFLSSYLEILRCSLLQMKEKTPLGALSKLMAGVGPTRDFVGALRARAAETGYPALIAEVKKASPSRGVIQPNFDPVRIAQGYEKGGATCLSVLTDSKYFQGGFENLRLIRNAGVQCPLLCKEFIIDAWQIYKARVSGADAVLLIAAVLPDQDLAYMTKIAKALGMAALIEVHSEREMKRVLGLPNVELIGINNRSLETFKVDINNTVELLKGDIGTQIRERNIIVVGESGLFTPEDIALVRNAGVGAVLVGESLVKQDDPGAGIAKLFGEDISRKQTSVA